MAIPIPIRVELPELYPAPRPEPIPREELISALCKIVAAAKMPPGRRRSDVVKVPADLVQQAARLIERETAAMAEADLSGEN